MSAIAARLGEALGQALLQLLLVIFAFGLWLSVLMWQAEVERVFPDNREGMEDVANPPPEPEGLDEDVVLVLSAATSEELDPFWRRNLPLIL